MEEIEQEFQSVDTDYGGLIEWSEFSKCIKESVTHHAIVRDCFFKFLPQSRFLTLIVQQFL